MRFLEDLKDSGFADPATFQGAAVLAVLFAFLAWFLGRLLRLAVQRLLAHDKHARVDLMAVKFLAKLARYCVYIFAFVAYAHFVPALSDLGSASLTSISGLKCDLLEQAKKRFAQEGIGLALTQTTLILKDPRQTSGWTSH